MCALHVERDTCIFFYGVHVYFKGYIYLLRGTCAFYGVHLSFTGYMCILWGTFIFYWVHVSFKGYIYLLRGTCVFKGYIYIQCMLHRVHVSRVNGVLPRILYGVHARYTGCMQIMYMG